MRQIPSAPEVAVVSGDCEQFTPLELYEYFTDAAKVVQWWPKVADADPRVGGEYHFAWPGNDWHLRGEFKAVDPGQHLAFTWAWDHEPSSTILKQVDIWFQPLFETGCRIAIYHGPYETTESDQASRQGVVEGWIHFGMVLAGLRDGAAE